MPIPTILTDFMFTNYPPYAIIVKVDQRYKSLPKLDLTTVKKTE